MNENQIKVVEELGDAAHNANRVADKLLNSKESVLPGQLVETTAQLLAMVALVVAAFELDEAAIFEVADKRVEPYKAIFPKLADN